MSTSAKTVLGIVIAVVIIAGGVWWYVVSRPVDQGANMVGYGNNQASASTASSSMPQGDSDQAIAQDMASANTQINGFNSDSANINQSMNDQPVAQGQ